MNRIIGPSLVALAAAVSVASPAVASDQDDFLRPLMTRYAYLSSEQLLSEASRVCQTVLAGNSASVAAEMVGKDLKVSTPAAIDIAVASIQYLQC